MKLRSLIALLLVLTLLLAGCGIPEIEGGTIRPAEGDTTGEASETPTGESEEASKSENKFALGTFKGGVYENTYVGYGCTLGEDWTYKSAEELQDLTELTAQLLEGSEVDELSDGLAQIIDMMAESSEANASINVAYTQLTTQQRLAHAVMTEEEVIDATLASKDILISSYAQAGMEVVTMDKVTVDFLGEERYAIYTALSISGLNCYLLQIIDINLGPYYVTLTLSSFGEDNTAALLDLFYTLD